MLSKRYETTDDDLEPGYNVLSGTHWSTSSDTHELFEI